MPELNSMKETERNCPNCLDGKLFAVSEIWQDDDSRIEIVESDWCRNCGYDYVTRDDGNHSDVPYERVVMERKYGNLIQILKIKKNLAVA